MADERYQKAVEQLGKRDQEGRRKCPRDKVELAGMAERTAELGQLKEIRNN